MLDICPQMIQEVAREELLAVTVLSSMGQKLIETTDVLFAGGMTVALYQALIHLAYRVMTSA